MTRHTAVVDGELGGEPAVLGGLTLCDTTGVFGVPEFVSDGVWHVCPALISKLPGRVCR